VSAGPLFRPVKGTKVGARGTVMIRPERLHFGESGEGLPVILSAAAFSGPSIRLALKTLSGQEMIGHVPSDGPRPVLEPGRRYVVSWEAEGARLLPESHAAALKEADPQSTLELASSLKLKPVA